MRKLRHGERDSPRATKDGGRERRIPGDQPQAYVTQHQEARSAI